MSEAKIDEKKMAEALKVVLEALNPLNVTERRRVWMSAGVFLGEWTGKDPKQHGGHDDCG